MVLVLSKLGAIGGRSVVLVVFSNLGSQTHRGEADRCDVVLEFVNIGLSGPANG